MRIKDIILYEKDGNIHVLKTDSISGFSKQFHQEVEEYLSHIQNEGYEIVDIKFNLNSNGGWYAVILYK